MAGDTAGSNIIDPLLSMVLLCLRLVMAFVTRPGGSPGGMALGADAARAAMVGWERMVEGGALPGIGIVTLRALPVKVVGWFLVSMARDAVGSSGCLVIEVRRCPGGGGMAG